MIYSFDIDGTIFSTKWNESKKQYDIKDVNYEIIGKINDLYYNGCLVVIATARHWDQLGYTKKQLEKHNVKYTTLVMGKPAVDKNIDDRSITPEDFLNEF